MRTPDPNKDAQLAGILLRLVYVNHHAQLQRTNSTLLHGVLQREGYSDFSGDEVLTQLQLLRDGNYVRFEQRRDFNTNRLYLFNIEITREGHNLFNGINSDPAVDIR